MSRSVKKPIWKDHPQDVKKWYWRTIRRTINLEMKKITKENGEDIIISLPKEIIDDYDYCDYIIDYRDNWAGEEYTKKMSRK